MNLKKRFALLTIAFLATLVVAVTLLDRQLDEIKRSRRDIREDRRETRELFDIRRNLAWLRGFVFDAWRDGRPVAPDWSRSMSSFAEGLADLERVSDHLDADEEEAERESGGESHEVGEELETRALVALRENYEAWMKFFAALPKDAALGMEHAARADELFFEGDEAASGFLSGALMEFDGALENLRQGESRLNRLFVQWSVAMVILFALAWIGFGLWLLVPVGRLRELVRRLRYRDFEAVGAKAGTGVSGPGEIGELTEAFLEMSRELGTFTDTLERRVAERTRELEDHRHRLSAMLDGLPDAVALVDEEGRVAAHNAPWSRLFGDGSVSPIPDILEQTEVTAAGDHRWRGPDGAPRLLSVARLALDGAEVAGSRLWLERARDETREREVEAALAASQKLAAIGRLSAGVAHEINNPLTSVAACAEGLIKRLAEGGGQVSDGEVLRDYLETIRDEVFRCKEITEKLLDHSRQRRETPSRADAVDVANGAIRLVRPLAERKSAEVRFTHPEGGAPFFGNMRAMQQIVVNLLLNAVEACEPGGGGRVEVNVRPKGDELILSVRDNGRGIEPEDLDKLFEPFFTRRRDGMGTGLGLFVAQGMAQAMGGKLECSSEGAGHGALFSLRLPAFPPGRRPSKEVQGPPAETPPPETAMIRVGDSSSAA